MKSKLFWTCKHLQQKIHDLRFTTKCWWLSQNIDFLEWLGQFDALRSGRGSERVRAQESGRYPMPSM